MAPSTRTSLAASAAGAAKRVVRRSGKKTTPKSAVAAKEAPSKKAPAKKTPAKKTPAAKNAPAAKKAPAKRVPAKKASASKKAAPAKKVPAKRASAAKKAPAKKTTPSSQTKAAKQPVTKKAPAAKAAAKKTVAKKAPASSLKVREGEDAWTRAELKEVLDDLHEHRERLMTAISSQQQEIAGLMKDAGDGAGHDQADVGASSFERDHEMTVVNNERDMLSQIDRALARIDDGTYGACESCGEAIGKMRLMAFPRATLCMSCKQREERR